MRATGKLIGARIKELRKRRGYSQDLLSEKIDIDPKHLSRIEVGKGYPSLQTLERIADALEVDMRDFFEFVPASTQKELKDDISKLLREASPDQLKTIYRVIKSIVR